MNRLVVSEPLLNTTWLGLRKRSAGVREAACVWLGDHEREQEVASEVVFLDDLPGTIGRPLQHRTSREAVNMMLDHARSRGLSIVADLHTHPSDWVELSPVDRAHPIEYRIGLLALVVPHYATGPVDRHALGVHEYLGRGEWTEFLGDDAATRLVILPGGVS